MINCKYFGLHFTMTNEDSFACRIAMPGISCMFPDMIIAGVCYWLVSFLPLFFLYEDIKSKKQNKEKIFDIILTYYLVLAAYYIFEGFIFTVDFGYTKNNYLLISGISKITSVIPLSLFVLIVCELLNSYWNPRQTSHFFLRLVFVAFFIVFLVLGVSLSIADDDMECEEGDYRINMIYLWLSCIDLIALLFTTIPAISLLKAITYPIIQPEDESCVKISKVGIVLFDIFFIIRIIFHFFNYLGKNPLVKFTTGENDLKHRLYLIIYSIIFEFIPSLLTLFGVVTLRKYEAKFSIVDSCTQDQKYGLYSEVY